MRTRLPLQLYFVADPACIEEILLKKAFEGLPPPDRLTSSDSVLGKMPYEKISRFIQGLPRR